MSMLRAVAWGMVDLKKIPIDEAYTIKRTIRNELEHHGLWVGGCDRYSREKSGRTSGECYSLTQFKVGDRTHPRLHAGTFEGCCRAALRIIEP